MRKKIFLVILPLALLLALMPLMVSAAGGPWSENFDSYSNNMDLHGVGGWKGWDNNQAFTAFTTNAQARSAPHSVDIAGASDLVHEFSANSGQWVFTAWQYIPGNMQGISYFIMQNVYNDGGPYNWSVQVQFDSTSGLMIDDGASGATQPFITDQWVEIRVEIDLDPSTPNSQGTHDFYYNGALFYSGTWTEHQAGGGSLTIGALDLFANNATSVYYDDLSLVQPPPPGEPGLAVDKSPDTQDVTSGGNADFTITITNTGTLTWTNVTATDALVAACDNAFTDMAPGAVETYNCTDVGVTNSYTNTVVVVGDVTGGPTMTVTDTAQVNVNAPTSVSLSSLGGGNNSISIVWVMAAAGVGIAAGVFFVSRRRRQQI